MDESSSKPVESASPTNAAPAPSPNPPGPKDPPIAPALHAPNPGRQKPAAGPNGYLIDKLEDAELLLGYAAELGIAVDNPVRDGVLQARQAAQAGGLTEPAAANLLASLTTLAIKVRPVTVESLRACASPKEARQAIRFYGKMGMLFGCLIVTISLTAFVSARVCERIKSRVELANGLASKLSSELGPPPRTNAPPPSVPDDSTPLSPTNAIPTLRQIRFGIGGPPAGLTEKDVISDLQLFAATMREIDGYARQLNHFVFNAAHVPYSQMRTNRHFMKQKFELSPGLAVPLAQELAEKIEAYQEVRNFGATVQEMVSVYYGAIDTCILPVLYALLGAGAYLLRLYEEQIKTRTFVAGDRHVARYIIAGIGGLVVGQFNVTSGAAVSPFAVAFLVGYAADVFFAFLEGLLQMFKRGPGAPGGQSSPANQ